MCDTTAYVLRGGVEEKLLENVERADLDGTEVTLSNIFGEQQTLSARLRLFDSSEGKLVFEPV